MRRLVPASQNDLAVMEDRIYPKLVTACEYSLGRFKAEDIIENIKKNIMQLWLAFNDEVLEGLLITEIVQYPQKRAVRIICLTGIEVDGWQKFVSVIEEWIPFTKQIESWGKSIGCSMSQIECPPTWELYLRDFEYKRGHVLLHKEII